MPYYVVDGSVVESCGKWWVDNARAARVVAEVVPIATCDGDAVGMPDFTAWVPPGHAHCKLDGVRVKRVEVDESRPQRPSYLLMVEPFEMGTPKETAVKPLEEAAEAFCAWQNAELDALESGGSVPLLHVLYKCCDVIQAVCNLMWRMGATDSQVMAAMRAVTLQNEVRGRYGAEYASDSKAICGDENGNADTD